MFDAIELSSIIRKKKKRAMEAEPELVHTDSKLDVTPDDMETVDMDAEIQHSLDSPERRDANEHQPEDGDALEMGATDKEKARMERLRSMLSSMSMGR